MTVNGTTAPPEAPQSVSPTADAPADAPAAAPATAAPDWDAVAEEIVCPLCGYNLRGLVDPRCPECGYAFRWPALLDPAERLHPYLFEHHPERNVRSFLRTMIGGLHPRRFWSGLQPAQRSRPRRLILYWLLVALLPFLACLGHAGWSLYFAAKGNDLARAVAMVKEKASLTAATGRSPYPVLSQSEVDRLLQAYVDARSPPTWSRRFLEAWYRDYAAPLDLTAFAVFAAWPWLTLATLMIFAASMRRAKVRPSHVLRCAIYCGDAGGWLLPLATVGYVLLVTPYSQTSRDLSPARLGALLSTVLLPLYTAFRLSTAYRLYLRFDRPRATAAAAQFIVWLLVVIVLLNLSPR